MTSDFFEIFVAFVYWSNSKEVFKVTFISGFHIAFTHTTLFSMQKFFSAFPSGSPGIWTAAASGVDCAQVLHGRGSSDASNISSL